MAWFSIAPAVLYCLALLILPGLLVSLAVRAKGFDAVAGAPAVSVAVVAGSAILAPSLGLRWAWWIPWAAALVLALVLGALAAVLRALVPDRALLPPGAAPTRWFSREQAAYWVALLLAVVLMLRHLKNGLGDPSRFSQTFDNNFHLNAIRYIAETGNASSLHLTTMTSGGQPASFYPAGWHDVVSLVFMAGGVSIPQATSAMILAVGAVVWPLSMLFLLRRMQRFGLPAILSAGAVLAGFVAFPLLLIWFGVLYPNFLGLALLPAVLGLALDFLRVGTLVRLDVVQSGALAVPAALGLALAHPNALMSLLIMAVPVVLVRACRQLVALCTRRVPVLLGLLQILGCLGALWLVWYLWGMVRPPASSATWGPTAGDAQSFGEAVLNSPLNLTVAQWSVSALAVLGAVVLLRTRRNVWAVLVWAVVVYYYIAVRYLNWDQDRLWATGVWYNDPYRLAALVPLAAIPLAVVGVDAVATFLARGLARWYAAGEAPAAVGTQEPGTNELSAAEPGTQERGAGARGTETQGSGNRGPGNLGTGHQLATAPSAADRSGSAAPLRGLPAASRALAVRARQRFGEEPGRTRRGRAAARTGAALVALAAVALTQFSLPMKQMSTNAYWSYYAGPKAPLVTAEELDVIEHLDQYVPADSTVVVDPWTGGALAYALADRQVTAAHTIYKTTHADDVVDIHLNQARTDPQVCQALNSLHARYVLDFGTQEINEGDHRAAFRGLQDLVGSGVATVVYRSGDAQLLRVTACG